MLVVRETDLRSQKKAESRATQWPTRRSVFSAVFDQYLDRSARKVKEPERWNTHLTRHCILQLNGYWSSMAVTGDLFSFTVSISHRNT